ncbi:hypothetical protein ATN38_04750 [Rhodococcus sp. FH8]|nr:hypothetical protein [Rhodococcus sp. FH8]
MMCVPPVSGGSDEFDAAGLFLSILVLAQLVRAKVAAAKAIRYWNRGVFTDSVGTGRDGISESFLMCRKRLRARGFVSFWLWAVYA